MTAYNVLSNNEIFSFKGRRYCSIQWMFALIADDARQTAAEQTNKGDTTIIKERKIPTSVKDRHS
jgi:hypothetical protein